jgi:hypothetical protein
MKRLLSVFCLLYVFVTASLAQTPIKFSFWGDRAYPYDNSVHGLELGIGTYTPELVGVGWNFIYAKTDNAKGWQHGLLTISKQFTGAQTGILNISETFEGFSWGGVNWNEGDVSGVQCGVFNIARSVKGAQIGFLNITENMHGIQLGFLNFIKTSKVPVMVIFNAKF